MTIGTAATAASAKEHLRALMVGLGRPGKPLGWRKEQFLADCTDEAAAVIADAMERLPGFDDIVRAETTETPIPGLIVWTDPKYAVAIARVFEPGLIPVPENANVPMRAHRAHELYRAALTEVGDALAVMGHSPDEGVFGLETDEEVTDDVRRAVRVCLSFVGMVPGEMWRLRRSLLVGVLASRIDADEAVRAVRERGVDGVVQMLGEAEGIPRPIADGWI